jgi:hypothetical protein
MQQPVGVGPHPAPQQRQIRVTMPAVLTIPMPMPILDIMPARRHGNTLFQSRRREDVGRGLAAGVMEYHRDCRGSGPLAHPCGSAGNQAVDMRNNKHTDDFDIADTPRHAEAVAWPIGKLLQPVVSNMRRQRLLCTIN